MTLTHEDILTTAQALFAPGEVDRMLGLWLAAITRTLTQTALPCYPLPL